MNFNLFKIVFASLLLFGFGSCSKNNPSDVIPNVSVDLIININEPSSFDLQPVGGYAYRVGGSNGLVIYHSGVDQFVCFDRHVTYNVAEWCKAEVDSTGFKLLDPCSSSEFSIFDGSVIQAPASIPLKQYPVIFDGTYLTIRN